MKEGQDSLLVVVQKKPKANIKNLCRKIVGPSHLSMITLNINGLNSQIKRYVLDEGILKIRPTSLLLTRNIIHQQRYTQTENERSRYIAILTDKVRL